MTNSIPLQGQRPTRSILAALADGRLSRNTQCIFPGSGSLPNPTVAAGIAAGLIDPQAPATSLTVSSPWPQYGGT
jgi:hypothetical protein